MDVRTNLDREYKYGWVTDIEADVAPRGLSEDVIRFISARKEEPDWMLDWRLRAYRHWAQLDRKQGEPRWANVHYPSIDYQDIRWSYRPIFASTLRIRGNSNARWWLRRKAVT